MIVGSKSEKFLLVNSVCLLCDGTNNVIFVSNSKSHKVYDFQSSDLQTLHYFMGVLLEVIKN